MEICKRIIILINFYTPAVTRFYHADFGNAGVFLRRYMRKLKKENNQNTNLPNIPDKEKIQKQVKFVLLISWIFPFFGLFFLHFSRKALYDKPKEILCKIINMEFTSIIILFILTSLLNTLAFSKVSGIIILFVTLIMLGILIYAVVSHIKGTLKWLKGEDFSFKYSVEFFKPYENINK